MRGYLKNRIKLSFLLFIFVLFWNSTIVAQSQRGSKTIIQDGDTLVLQAIPLTNITKNIEIYDGLNEAGITIPFPQQDLHVKSIEPEVEKILLQTHKTTKNTKRASK